MGNARIENKDSSNYDVPVKVSGTSGSVSIPRGTTTVSWNGGAHDAVVQSGGVSFPGGKIENGASYRISGGKATKA